MQKRVLFTLLFILYISSYLYSKYCHFCSSYLTDEKTICPYCQNPQKKPGNENEACSACKAINADNRYCTNCGYSFYYMHDEFKQAVIDFYQKKYNAALTHLDGILKKDKYFYPAIRYKINTLILTGQFQQYYHEIKSKAQSSQDISLLYTLGYVYLMNNEKDNSYAVFKQALKEYPQFSEVHMEIYEITKDPTYLEKAIEDKPSYYLPYIKISQSLFQEGKYEMMGDYLSYALTLFPYDYEIWYLKGRLEYSTGNFNTVTMKYYKNSIKYNPFFMPAYYYLARLYLQNNNVLDALKTFKYIIDQNDQDEITMLSLYYSAKLIDRVLHYDLLTLETSLKDRDYLTYYKKAFQLLNRIKHYQHSDEAERSQLKELQTLFENYEKGFIDKYEFLDQRKYLFFPRDNIK
ncbi:MAG: hypothetical protein JW827_03840 [Spirochaetes bacterium]|nr:hypothetical protein [Spirochaetota bacterium]